MFRNFTKKVTGAVLAVSLLVGGILVPQRANGSAILGLLGEALISNIGEWISGGDEIAKLMVLILNTQTQIDQMKGDFEKNAEKYESWKKSIKDLQALRDGLVETKQVYYAAVNVSSFYKGIGNYWEYAKRNGFSNFSSCIRTASEGIRLAQQVTRDAVAIVNLSKGKDENGKETNMDAYTASSRVRYFFERMNTCKKQWTDAVNFEGVFSAGAEGDRAASESLSDPDGSNSIYGILKKDRK